MQKTQRNFLIAVVLGLLLFFLIPAANGLTPMGVRFLAVFIPVVFIWLIEGGSGWSALLGATLLVLLGCYDGAETYKLLWGGALVSMCIPFYMVANALEESGAVMWVVRWVLSRKIVHGRPFVFSVLFVLTLIFCSIFVTPMVTVVIFFKVLKDLTATVGLDRESSFFRAHGLLIAWVGQGVDGSLIWGRPFIVSMVAMIVGLGFDLFTINDYFKLSILYLAILTVISIAIVYLWLRPDTKKFKDFDDAAVRAGREAPAVDFYAEKDGERWAIRCRKPDAAQSDPEAAAGAGVPGRRSLIFSNRPFSEGVQRAAEQSNVTLWDSDRMETIIRVAFPEYSVDYYRAMQETGWKGSLKKDGKIALLYALLALIFYFIMFR